MKKNFLLLSAVLWAFTAFSQTETVVADTAAAKPEPINERVQGIQKRKALESASLVKNLSFTNIGPTIMSGRVTDLEVNPKDATKFYVAYASGGLGIQITMGSRFAPFLIMKM